MFLSGRYEKRAYSSKVKQGNCRILQGVPVTQKSEKVCNVISSIMREMTCGKIIMLLENQTKTDWFVRCKMKYRNKEIEALLNSIASVIVAKTTTAFPGPDI